MHWRLHYLEIVMTVRPVPFDAVVSTSGASLLVDHVPGYRRYLVDRGYILPDRVLTGYITKLVRPKDETAGTITLESILGDVERKVRVALTGDDYHLAVIAHDNGQMVRVQGDVHIKPKTAELLSPKNFGAIKMENLL